MKKLSLLLAVIMVMTSIALPSLAEDAAIKESASGFYYIEANGEQVRLSAADASKFFQADGLWFKDMNGNGELDVYEDWRLDDATRTADLLTKMSLQMKAGTLGFGGIGGKNGITVTDFAANNPTSGTSGVAFIQPDSEQMNNDTDILFQRFAADRFFWTVLDGFARFGGWVSRRMMEAGKSLNKLRFLPE